MNRHVLKRMTWVLLAVMLGSCVQPALAATILWDGGGNTETWFDDGNWDDGGGFDVSVQDDDDLIYGQIPTISFFLSDNDGVLLSVSSIVFDSTDGVAGFDVTSSTDDVLQITGAAGIANNQNVGTNTVSSRLQLQINSAFSSISTGGNLLTISGTTIDLAGFDLTVNGAGDTNITGQITGNGNLTKDGAGTLFLSGANDFTTSTAIAINAGTVNAGGVAQLGNAANDLAFNGGSLVISNNGTTETLGTDASVSVDTGGGAIDVFFAGTTVDLQGTLTGAGTLTKRGAGILTLSTTAKDLGGTLDVTAGTVNVNVSSSVGALNSTAGAGNVNIANGVALTIDGTGVAGVAAGNITGGNAASSIVFTGSGNQTLSGVNTFAGVETVNSANGTLILSGGNATLDPTGSGNAATGGGAVNVTAGTLQVDTSETVGALNGAAGSSIVLGNNVNLTLGNETDQVIQSSVGDTNNNGILTKQGSGVLSITALNTYDGATNINGGTVSITAATNIGSTGADLAFGGGALRFDANNITFDATRLVALNDDAPIDVQTNGNIATINGVISGAAGNDLNKVGAGTLVLTGVNTYQGATNVNVGVLRNNGSSNNSAVAVASGATYGGTGSAASVNIAGNGILAPGNSIGTNSFTGNVVFAAANSNFNVEVNAAGQGDRTNAGGTATLNGANVNVDTAAGAYAFRTNYTILSATGGLTGTFGTVTLVQPNTGLNPTVTNIGTNAVLSLQNGNFTLVPAAATANQQNVATAINQIIALNQVPLFSDLEGVLNTVSLLGVADQRSFLSQITPEVQASATSAALLGNTMFAQTTLFRQASMRSRSAHRRATGATTPTAAYGGKVGAFASSATASAMVSPTPLALANGLTTLSANDQDWEIWALGFDMSGDLDSDGNAARTRFDSDGFNLGAAKQLDDEWLLGFNIGSGDTKVRRVGFSDFTNIDSTNYGVYASWDHERWSLDLQAGIVDSDFSSARFIVVPGVSRTATAKYNGDEFYALGEVSYLATDGDWQVRPTFSLQLRNLDIDSFSESGAGALNLTVGKQEIDLFQSGLGVRVSRRFDGSEGGWWEPELKLRWQHEFGDTARRLTSSFVGTTPQFTTAGRAIDEDVLQTRVGITGGTDGGLEVNASYFREDASGQDNDGWVGYATYKF